jgi:hypothetical protein
MYQVTFTYVVVFKKKDVFFSALADFAHKTYFAEVLIAFGILFSSISSSHHSLREASSR